MRGNSLIKSDRDSIYCSLVSLIDCLAFFFNRPGRNRVPCCSHGRELSRKPSDVVTGGVGVVAAVRSNWMNSGRALWAKVRPAKKKSSLYLFFGSSCCCSFLTNLYQLSSPIRDGGSNQVALNSGSLVGCSRIVYSRSCQGITPG